MVNGVAKRVMGWEQDVQTGGYFSMGATVVYPVVADDEITVDCFSLAGMTLGTNPATLYFNAFYQG
jgi:hypothetical protein